jgi:hypothetical protein
VKNRTSHLVSTMQNTIVKKDTYIGHSDSLPVSMFNICDAATKESVGKVSFASSFQGPSQAYLRQKGFLIVDAALDPLEDSTTCQSAALIVSRFPFVVGTIAALSRARPSRVKRTEYLVSLDDGSGKCCGCLR